MDRRRAPRIEILGRLHGRAVSLDVPLTVREISLVGMALETADAFAAGAVHEFLLTLGDGAGVLLHARVVHSRPEMLRDGRTVTVTGFEFVDADENGAGGVGQIIDRMR